MTSARMTVIGEILKCFCKENICRIAPIRMKVGDPLRKGSLVVQGKSGNISTVSFQVLIVQSFPKYGIPFVPVSLFGGLELG